MGAFHHRIRPWRRGLDRERSPRAGVYLLYTPSNFFTLPGGATSVLYIGKASKSKGLRARLREHRTFTQEVRDEVYPRGYARYEWITLHPARAAYSAAPDGVDSRSMENNLLLAFADAFRVAPLGNAQSAWEKAEEEE